MCHRLFLRDFEYKVESHDFQKNQKVISQSHDIWLYDFSPAYLC